MRREAGPDEDDNPENEGSPLGMQPQRAFSETIQSRKATQTVYKWTMKSFPSQSVAASKPPGPGVAPHSGAPGRLIGTPDVGPSSSRRLLFRRLDGVSR